MRWGWKLWLVTTVGLSFALAGSAGATSEYVSGNGLLKFSDFEFHGVDPDDIDIIVLEDGIKLSGEEGVWGIDLNHFTVSYTVMANSSAGINGASLELASAVNSSLGAVFAHKKITMPQASGPDAWEGEPAGEWSSPDLLGDFLHEGGPADALAKLTTYDIESGIFCLCGHEHASLAECHFQDLFDEADFEPKDMIRVTDVVKIANLDPNGEVLWYMSTNRFSVVPEPGTAALLGVGLLALTATRRRRRD